MSANLGATSYNSVVWTAGDIITEAKLDNMIANDQAYDSHADQGLLLSNERSFGAEDSVGSNYNLMRINSGNNVELGDSALAGEILTQNTLKLKRTYQDIVSEADGATITFDLADGNIQQTTLAGNRTLALANVKVGQAFVVRLTQDGTGSRLVTWWSDINWDNNSTPVLTTTPGRTDVFGFLCTLSGNYDGFILGQNIPD